MDTSAIIIQRYWKAYKWRTLVKETLGSTWVNMWRKTRAIITIQDFWRTYKWRTLTLKERYPLMFDDPMYDFMEGQTRVINGFLIRPDDYWLVPYTHEFHKILYKCHIITKEHYNEILSGNDHRIYIWRSMAKEIIDRFKEAIKNEL